MIKQAIRNHYEKKLDAAAERLPLEERSKDIMSKLGSVTTYSSKKEGGVVEARISEGTNLPINEITSLKYNTLNAEVMCRTDQQDHEMFMHGMFYDRVQDLTLRRLRYAATHLSRVARHLA